MNSKRTYEDATENLTIGAQEVLKTVKMDHIKEAAMKVGSPSYECEEIGEALLLHC